MSSDEQQPGRRLGTSAEEALADAAHGAETIRRAMSSGEQQPAEYRRKDMSREPRSLAGQQAAAEGMAAARFQEQMLGLFATFERERRAEILAAGGDPDEDRDPFEAVRAIADEWADTASDADRRAALLDHLADRLDTTEVRALRLAAEAAATLTPRLIYADADHGVSAAATAEDLGVTESYVYRILRNRDRAQ